MGCTLVSQSQAGRESILGIAKGCVSDPCNNATSPAGRRGMDGHLKDVAWP